MQCSPLELREKLRGHLDNDYNVVDMQGVLDVMLVLEKYPITKENLEQTRIGKFVNEMRRKTTDRELAKRAKDLVRKWQQLVSGTSVTNAASTTDLSRVSSSTSLATTNGVRPSCDRPSNGQHVKSYNDAVGVVNRHADPRTHPSVTRTNFPLDHMVPLRAGSQPSTPVTGFHSTVTNSLSRSSTPGSGPSRPVTPATPSLQPSTSSVKPPTELCYTPVESHPLKHTSSSGRLVMNGTDSTSRGFDCQAKTTLGKRKLTDYDNGASDAKRTCSSLRNGALKNPMVYHATPSPNNGLWSAYGGLETNTSGAANSVASVPTDSGFADAPITRLKIKINRTSTTGSVSSPAANSPSAVAPVVRKTPKVLPTAQLIQKLHANGDLRLLPSKTLNMIATNQIEHEADEAPGSIVPEGAKPRPHKKRRSARQPEHEPPAMTDTDLLAVKAERVRNYLQMTAEASPPAADHDLLGLLGRLAESASESAPLGIDAVAEHEPAVDIDSHEVDLLQLPSLDDFQVDWESDVYTMPDVRPAPTEADVDRVLGGEWPSVNGQYDYHGSWSDWTRSYSARSYNGDLLHILPYVDLGD